MCGIRGPRALAGALALLAIASMAGCGEEESTAGGTSTFEAGAAVEVVGTEYAFDPTSVVVEGGGPLEITLVNQGSLAHNLTVFDGEAEVGGTSTFQGGESDTTEVELEPGSYEMICTVGDHEALGMVGELEVR
jgi:plastocyanin